jgi:ribosomal protein S10
MPNTAQIETRKKYGNYVPQIKLWIASEAQDKIRTLNVTVCVACRAQGKQVQYTLPHPVRHKLIHERQSSHWELGTAETFKRWFHSPLLKPLDEFQYFSTQLIPKKKEKLTKLQKHKINM